MYKHILIATDGSEFAAKGVRHGLELAKALGSQVTITTVTEPWDAEIVGDVAVTVTPADYEKMTTTHAAKLLDAAKAMAAQLGVAAGTLHISERRPAEGIIEAATDTGCDLIVMASHGRRGLSRLLLGSQANEVVTHSSVPVLIVR
ncbi:MAG TPA: universal stress protein [Hyphomicrobiales bacterium]|jgi:nucleotide-binding universal stress UspA family protein